MPITAASGQFVSSDMNDIIHNHESHKDSCKYGVDLSKLFITLASAGLAFTAGIGLKVNPQLSTVILIWTLALFSISIGFGLLFVMNVVGYINRHDNYNVYSKSLRAMMAFQLITFALAVVLVGKIAIGCVDMTQVSPPTKSNLIVINGNKRVEQNINANSKIKINVNNDKGIEIQIEPQ